MSKNLEKLALAVKKNTHSKKEERLGMKASGIAIGLMGAGEASVAASILPVLKKEIPDELFEKFKNIDDVTRKTHFTKSGIPGSFPKTMVDWGKKNRAIGEVIMAHSGYSPMELEAKGKHQVVIGGNIDPYITAHELGHIRGPLGKSRALAKIYLAGKAAPLLPILGAGTLALSNKKFKEKYGKEIGYGAAGLSAATLAPILIEEARASVKGLADAKKVLGPSYSKMTAAKRLLPAWGSYALTLGGPAAGLAWYTKKKFDNK